MSVESNSSPRTGLSLGRSGEAVAENAVQVVVNDSDRARCRLTVALERSAMWRSWAESRAEFAVPRPPAHRLVTARKSGSEKQPGKQGSQMRTNPFLGGRAGPGTAPRLPTRRSRDKRTR